MAHLEPVEHANALGCGGSRVDDPVNDLVLTVVAVEDGIHWEVRDVSDTPPPPTVAGVGLG